MKWSIFESDALKNLQCSLNFKGILFTHLSNISFAVGQILLKKFFEKATELPVICTSPVIYLDSTIMCMTLTLSSIFIPKFIIPSTSCIFSLLVLEIIFFGVAQYLWNIGITKTILRTDSVLSNKQIPMAVIRCVWCLFLAYLRIKIWLQIILNKLYLKLCEKVICNYCHRLCQLEPAYLSYLWKDFVRFNS